MDTLSETIAKLRELVNKMQVALDQGALDDEGIRAYERTFDMYQRAQDALAREQDRHGERWA